MMATFWVVVGIAVAAFVVWWIIDSPRSPLWKALERRPRRIDAASLSKKFKGLALFGLEGASLSLRECDSGDELAFVKRVAPTGFAFAVSVSSDQSPDDLRERIVAALATLGSRFSADFEPGDGANAVLRFRLSGSSLGDPGAMEGVATLILRCLGHARDARYRVAFEGPADYKIVNEYFGLEG